MELKKKPSKLFSLTNMLIDWLKAKYDFFILWLIARFFALGLVFMLVLPKRYRMSHNSYKSIRIAYAKKATKRGVLWLCGILLC